MGSTTMLVADFMERQVLTLGAGDNLDSGVAFAPARPEAAMAQLA